MSCDNYSDIWQPFAECWQKFWPQCPYPTYLVSEIKSFQHPHIDNIQTGKKMPWGEMLLHVLDRINTNYVLYLQEDYLLRSPVDEERIAHLIQLVAKLNAAYLRLLPWPGPDAPHPDYEDIGILHPTSQYRTSLQAAFWDKWILKSIVNVDDDGRFESWSIQRAKEIDRPFLCLKRNGLSEDINHDGDYPLNYFATSVFQGKWLKEAVRLYKSLGIDIDTSHRGVMNRIDFMEYHERKKGQKHLKYRFIRIVQNILNRLSF